MQKKGKKAAKSLIKSVKRLESWDKWQYNISEQIISDMLDISVILDHIRFKGYCCELDIPLMLDMLIWGYFSYYREENLAEKFCTSNGKLHNTVFKEGRGEGEGRKKPEFSCLYKKSCFLGHFITWDVKFIF